MRLIIPECQSFDNGYCNDANKLQNRLKILEQAINVNRTELIITSHNFFAFFPSYRVNTKNFIERKIIPLLNSNLSRKIPLLLGFDLLTNTNGKSATLSKFDSYNGINAIVCFLDVKNNSYVYKTHIWECWKSKGNCDQNCFSRQNKNRVFTFKNVNFGMLSCGDIAKYCHNNGQKLPNVDIYVDLSHKSLKGQTSQNRIPNKLINQWNKCKFVLVTQQVKNVQNYVRKGKYPYIFPQNIEHKVGTLSINRKRVGVIVDIF